jgi:methionyl-tRNA formyltransferase
MRVAITGQQDFGKAVLEAFLARGDEVAGVFCAPEKPGGRPDALKVAAQEKGVKVFQFASLKSDEAKHALKDLDVEIGIMAFVLQFAPQDFVTIPKRGTIQFHPSLLPKYRGPSSINWPIARGDMQTGLTIFRPTDGLDEGPVILQKTTPIGPDDTLGTVYFDRLFPMGVKAMLEAADLVVAGKHRETTQDESQSTTSTTSFAARTRRRARGPCSRARNCRSSTRARSRCARSERCAARSAKSSRLQELRSRSPRRAAASKYCAPSWRTARKWPPPS